MKDVDGFPQPPILLFFNRPDEAIGTYRRRWQTEACFKSMKFSESNMEDTHLANIERIALFFTIVTIAFLYAYLVGFYRNRHIRKIRILNNGRRAVFFFKYALYYIVKFFLNPLSQT